jgi:dynein heavy chain
LLIGDDTKKDMPFTQEATIKTQYRRLRKYSRLIDYFVLSSKIEMIINSTNILVNKIKEFKP